MYRIEYSLIWSYRVHCKNGNLYLILVVSLPHKDVASYYGAKALTSVSKHGAYVQYQNHFYELFVDVDTSSWKWIVMEKELGNAVYGPVMMYLPPEYTCRPFWNQTSLIPF